jgi:chitodextrinase
MVGRLVLLCVAWLSLLAAICTPAEASVTRLGTLQATVLDDFQSGHSETRYRLRSGERETVVQPTELDAEPGDRVAITGEFRGDRLVGTVRETNGNAQAQAISPGPRKTAVVLFTFSGELAEPWSPAESRSEVFTAANSVSAFYEEESYGDISLTGKLRSDGDVFGWLSVNTSTAGCPFEAWRNAAAEAAADAGIDLSGYQHVIYEFPHQNSCGTVLGIAGLSGNSVMINGNFFGTRRQTTIHELGHNLGLLHAGSWTCTANGERVQISDTCSTAEYGDPFDAMGNIAMRHNNGWNLAKLGILKPENVETIEASGDYSMRSALHPTIQPTVLRIPRARDNEGDVTSWYCLEIRQTGGVFENVTDASVSGVSIRATDMDSSPETLLLDANPATATFQDAPLRVGENFEGGTARITTLSAAGGSATVSIELDEEPPTPPSGLTATGGLAGVQLQWGASSDDFGVDRYVVFRDGSEIATTASTSFFDSLAPVGEHEYVVHAEDAIGNRSAASNPATATVEPDEEPPTAPSGLTAAVGLEGVQLQWAASTDNLGVDHYVVFRDGSEIGTPGATGFLDSIAPVGEREYVVYAEDAAGNRSDASEPATATVPAVLGPICASGSCGLTFRYTGTEATWNAPPGVGAAEFTVEGARGGSDLPATSPGSGGRVVATLGSLTAGQAVTVSVGGAGKTGAEGGAGGFNGGGDGALSGGGGGFSSVLLDSTPMLLAAGGGGDGSKGSNTTGGAEPRGGRGGQGGEVGTAGLAGAVTEAHGATLGRGNGGASGGLGGAGGTGGTVTGTSTCPGGASAGAFGAPGSGFAGGGGKPAAGAGGGGGYVGGGQGGGAARDECGDLAGSGGGGGGSSFAAAGLSATFMGGVRRGDGQVSIAYSDPISAASRSYVTEPGQELVVSAATGVLSGASGPAGDPLSAGVESPPAHGSLGLDGDGSFTYAPDPGYAGADSFSYRATDSAGNYATAVVALAVAESPSASISTPLDGGTYLQGQVVNADFSCADGIGGPGIFSCAGTVADGAAIDTAVIGSHEFMVTATSKDGLDSPLSVTYTIEASPPPITPPGPPPVVAPPIPPPAAAIETARAVVARGRVKIMLSCSGGAPGSACEGALSLSSVRTRYRVDSGKTLPVVVRLSAATLRRLGRAPRRALRVPATATATDGRSTSRVLVLQLGLHTRSSAGSSVRKRSGPLR